MVVFQKRSPPRIFVPDILARWPYPRRINPHYVTEEKESAAWAESFSAFSPKAQHAFNRCDFPRLGSLTYPMANKEHLRTACDYMSLVFVIDEYTDFSHKSEVKRQKDALMDAVRNPHKPRPEGDWVGAEMARQFWELAIRNGASEECQKRFVAAFDDFLERGILQQAIDKSGHRSRDMNNYFEIRRESIGTRPVFALIEWHFNIPDEVMSHPAIEEMIVASTDMVILANDITSFNIEQSIDDISQNIITIVIEECGTDVNGAMLWAQDYHTKAEQKFHAAMAVLPEFDEPLNSQVREFCNGLGDWVRGNYSWHFESGRYFGTKGTKIMEERWMSLMPKHESGKVEVGPLLVDSSLL